MSQTDFYLLGRSFAQDSEKQWYADLPSMNYDERLDFNRGYTDGIREQRVAMQLFVAVLLIAAAIGIMALVK